MQKIAIVGASGFIGTRLVEYLYLNGHAEVVPVVRRFSSLAVLARFELDWKVCDHFDPFVLSRAFSGCQIVVHAAIGDEWQIVEMAKAVYQGAERAGVRRLVVLSSAAVHGQNVPTGTREETPLNERQSLPYGNAKIRAEKILRALRFRGTTELVILRPSVVYGPRSRWIAQIAGQLLENSAYLVDGGTGICNCVYVDNLIHAVLLASKSQDADREAFFISDSETITWKEYYEHIAGALGCGMSSVHKISMPEFKHSLQDRFNRFKATKVAMKVSSFIPERFKNAVKANIAAWDEPYLPSACKLTETDRIYPTEEICLLQQSAYKLPNLKAEKILGYRPVFSFAEGMKRSVDWLRFAGYRIDVNG